MTQTPIDPSTSGGPIPLRSPITHPTQLAWEQIAEVARRDKRNVLPIFGPKLSLILDPMDKHWESHKTLILNESLSLLVLDEDSHEPVLIIDIFDEITDPVRERTRDISALLRQAGVRYITSTEPHIRSIGGRLEPLIASPAWSAAPGRRSPINKAQLTAVEAVNRAAISNGFLCLHEVALEKIINLASTEFKHFVKSTGEITTRYFKQTSFDAVVCLPRPICVPVALVEFDGTDHEKPQQQQNDRRKNRVCEQAGLVLIRVTSPQFNRSLVPNRAAINEKYEFLSRLSGYVAKGQAGSAWLVDKLCDFIVAEADDLPKPQALVSDAIRCAVAELRSLTKSREQHLWDEVSSQVDHIEYLNEANRVRWESEEALNSPLDDEDYREGVGLEEPSAADTLPHGLQATWTDKDLPSGPIRVLTVSSNPRMSQAGYDFTKTFSKTPLRFEIFGDSTGKYRRLLNQDVDNALWSDAVKYFDHQRADIDDQYRDALGIPTYRGARKEFESLDQKGRHALLRQRVKGPWIVSSHSADVSLSGEDAGNTEAKAMANFHTRVEHQRQLLQSLDIPNTEKRRLLEYFEKLVLARRALPIERIQLDSD